MRATTPTWCWWKRAKTDGGANLFAKCGWSPFAGINFGHRIKATWVNGALRFQDGKLLPGPYGQPLQFVR